MKILKLAVLALALSLMSIGSAFAHGSSVRIGVNLGNPIVTHRHVPRYWGGYYYNAPRVYYNTPRVYYSAPPVIYYSQPIRRHHYRHHLRDRGDRYFSRGERRYYRKHRDRGYDRGRFNGRANNNRRGWR